MVNKGIETATTGAGWLKGGPQMVSDVVCGIIDTWVSVIDPNEGTIRKAMSGDAATLDELASLASTIGSIVFVVYVCMTAVNLFLATAESVRDYFKNYLTIPKLSKAIPVVGQYLAPADAPFATVTGPTCCIGGNCFDNTFDITDAQGNGIGQILKKKPDDFNDALAQGLSDADNFTLSVKPDLDKKVKAADGSTSQPNRILRMALKQDARMRSATRDGVLGIGCRGTVGKPDCRPEQPRVRGFKKHKPRFKASASEDEDEQEKAQKPRARKNVPKPPPSAKDRAAERRRAAQDRRAAPRSSAPARGSANNSGSANFERSRTVTDGVCKFPQNMLGCEIASSAGDIAFLSADKALECEGTRDGKVCASKAPGSFPPVFGM